MARPTDESTMNNRSGRAARAGAARGDLGRRVLMLAMALSVAGGVGCQAMGEGEAESAEVDIQTDVITTTYPAARHLTGPIAYPEDPPMGGPHNPIWQNCGIYAVPIHSEHAVHSLEHGAVWITYRPDLPAADVQRLRALAADDYMLLSPYPGLPAPVVASAWNHQIRLTGADDPRLPSFIRTYKSNPQTTPEFGATCAGGLGVSAEADTLNLAGGMP